MYFKNSSNSFLVVISVAPNFFLPLHKRPALFDFVQASKTSIEFFWECPLGKKKRTTIGMAIFLIFENENVIEIHLGIRFSRKNVKMEKCFEITKAFWHRRHFALFLPPQQHMAP